MCFEGYPTLAMSDCGHSFTTRPLAVPDVLVSGRNDGALRPGRRVGFRSLGPGGQTTFPGDILFL